MFQKSEYKFEYHRMLKVDRFSRKELIFFENTKSFQNLKLQDKGNAVISLT